MAKKRNSLKDKLLLTLTVLAGATLYFLVLISVPAVYDSLDPGGKPQEAKEVFPDNPLWHPPDTTQIPNGYEGERIRYGRLLITKTSHYLGPKGTVAAITNGMNCQNCHLDAGTKPYGNNYSAVFSCYPRFRERSGAVESTEKRINDCMERSLNGWPLPHDSREMEAILAYIRWVGTGVKTNERPRGVGIQDLPFPERAADPLKGKILYHSKCMRCHGAEGQGFTETDGKGYRFPPLWGQHSFTIGAGLFRLSRFAGFIKDNMPFGVRHDSTELSNEEAWDLAAFINAQPRPTKDLSHDWPVLSTKPFDYPFGPYADGFSEKQHKFGPFQPIVKAREEAKKTQ